eukprot:595701-Pelagomonas_calceolata.AAC.1
MAGEPARAGSRLRFCLNCRKAKHARRRRVLGACAGFAVCDLDTQKDDGLKFAGLTRARATEQYTVRQHTVQGQEQVRD